MPEQSHAITISHPPNAVLRLINPVFKALLRTPLRGPVGKELMVVSFTGRKTGRRYSIPLSAYHIDGILYAITGARWKNNFRDGATAQVLHDGKAATSRGELIDDRATVADLAYRASQAYGAKRAQRALGVKFRDGQVPSLAEFTEAVGREHLAAIKFTPAT
ncbi:MAG: hypothetical protein WA317_01300 [Mycobacterium sp.]|uniref:hypothetical protein n=1 Tax=Mycobacterium sp. TaxID=1785 RepID=UPI003CC686ED